MNGAFLVGCCPVNLPRCSADGKTCYSKFEDDVVNAVAPPAVVTPSMMV
jgi:hypothetical protein